MKLIKTFLLSTAALLPFSSSALSQVLLQDNFAPSSASNWATRLIGGASVQFNDALVLTPNAGNPQPAAAYRSFSNTSLADGQILRMTFDVSISSTNSQTSFIRFGLGFANPLITGTSSNLAVPLSGYYGSVPVASSTFGSIVNWVNGTEATPLNFFNALTTSLGGSPAFPEGVSVTTVAKPVVWEVARIGGNLTFSGSLDGTAFFSGTATGADVLSGFQFNTVAFGYAYDGATATYENFTLAVIPEPSTLAYLGGLTVALLAIRRREPKSRREV